MSAQRPVARAGITGSRPVLLGMCAVLGLTLFVPALHNGYWENLFRTILMYGAMALGWNIIGGYTGYVSFGNVMFFGVGAYTSAMLSKHGVDNMFVCALVAVILAALYAIALGLPILRLRGHYFAIATLGAALATSEIISNVDVFGSSTGLSIHQSANFSMYYYGMWLVCAGSLAATYAIARSKLGYALVAIRENEEAAAVLGINPTLFKVIAWAISAAMAGAAGSVFAFSNGFIDPVTAFSVDNNVFPIVMALLGGVGTVGGPVLGAFVLTAINETLWGQYPKIHTLFFGAVIVVVVLFLPQGILQLLRGKLNARLFFENLRAYRV